MHNVLIINYNDCYIYAQCILYGGYMNTSKKEQHWKKTKSLTVKTLIAWAIVAFVINFFGDSLNGSFPGAYFMAGMGSQIFLPF